MSVFSYKKLYEDLNRARKMRNNLSWNKVAARAGIAPTGLHVFVAQFEKSDSQVPKALSVDTLVQLLNWLRKTDLEPYLVDEDSPDASI